VKSLLDPRSLQTDLACLLLRVLFGSLFVYYGWLKVAGYEQMAAAFPDIIGIGARLSLILVIFAELVCGLLVLVGFLTRLSVIPIFITMVVAYFIAHAADPFQVKQVAFIHLSLCAVVFILGSGRFSVDAVLFRRPSTKGSANRQYRI
jgi:putative oxidoreductase